MSEAGAWLVDGSADAELVVVFAHGAGAPMDTPFMTELARSLAQAGCRVVRFEFPYMARLRASGKRSAPDRMPLLEASFSEVVRAQGAAENIVLAGKSMGGRVATRIADSLGVRGVIALGYPFHPPKKPEQVRTAHLADLATPCLIVQGTRDPLGSKTEVDGYALAARTQVSWIEDGDHSFVPRKKSGRTPEQNMGEVVVAMRAFLGGLSRAAADRTSTAP